jgi:hypothetical protein
MSTTVDPQAAALLERHSELQRKRDLHDAAYQEIKDLVRPDTSDFNAAHTRPADSRRRIFDGTAPWALDQLASGLHSHLSSPVDLWFSLGVIGVPFSQLPFEAKAWLEETTETIYSHYSSPLASFNSIMHECYLDVGAFGTSVIYQDFDREDRSLNFRAYALGDCWIDENSKGQVDTIHRSQKFTVRQVEQEFGSLTEKLQKMKPSDTVTVIHEVRPRKDRDRAKRNPTNKPWASTYVCKDTSETLSESGYDWMPYHVARWAKLAGEIYGRSPALSVLPEIRMVNQMSKTMITAAQKMVDPALMVEDDGYMLPVRTAPGSLNFRRPGAEPIMPMPTAQRIDVGIEMVEQRREMIRRGFYVDWLVRQTKRERQTAQEIMDDRNQMLSMLGPIVGRLQGELLGPLVALSYNLLRRAGQITPPPPILEGAPLEPVYISPAAKAQTLVRGQGMMAYISQITQLMPVLPGLIHSIDEDALNAELQDLTDAPRRILLPPEETARRREAAEQQQQALMMAEQAPNVAKATKDFAQAGAIDV